MRLAIEKAILAVVDNKTAKTTHSMCVAATVSVRLRAVCSWIATIQIRKKRHRFFHKNVTKMMI